MTSSTLTEKCTVPAERGKGLSEIVPEWKKICPICSEESFGEYLRVVMTKDDIQYRVYFAHHNKEKGVKWCYVPGIIFSKTIDRSGRVFGPGDPCPQLRSLPSGTSGHPKGDIAALPARTGKNWRERRSTQQHHGYDADRRSALPITGDTMG